MILTPLDATGTRFELEVEETEELAAYLALPRVRGEKVRVTSTTGERWLIRRIACTLPRCLCDAEAERLE